MTTQLSIHLLRYLYPQMSVLCRWLFLISALPQSMCAQWAAHTHAFHMNSLWEWKRKKTAASILKLDNFLFKNNHANHKRWQLCPWLSTKSYLQVMVRIQENVCGFHANTFMPVDIRTWNWCVGLGIHGASGTNPSEISRQVCVR